MEWISVNNQLPEENKKVIIYDTDWGIQFGRYCGKDYWSVCGQISFTNDVTHWMPLPEPPQEEFSNADHRKQRGRTAPNKPIWDD